MKPKMILILVLAVLLLVILVQNAAVVSVKLFFWEMSVSLVVLILLTGGLGFLLGFLAAKLTANGGEADWT